MTLLMKEQRLIGSMLSDSARLVNLDQLWTYHLSEAGAPSDQDSTSGDTFELIEIGRDMVRSLESIRDALPNFLFIVDHSRDEYSSGYREAMAADWISTDLKVQLQTSTLVYDYDSGILSEEIEDMERKTTQEIDIIDRKLDILRSGNFVPGDLSTSYLCQLSLASVAGGLLLPFPTGMPGVFLGLTILLLVHQSGDTC